MSLRKENRLSPSHRSLCRHRAAVAFRRRFGRVSARSCAERNALEKDDVSLLGGILDRIIVSEIDVYVFHGDGAGDEGNEEEEEEKEKEKEEEQDDDQGLIDQKNKCWDVLKFTTLARLRRVLETA